ncbi:MAG: hypothetical protein IJU48_11475 [Synergistaceae bacterium]|nr:hypothetical protein [Synergistaceae bacterium]
MINNVDNLQTFIVRKPKRRYKPAPKRKGNGFMKFLIAIFLVIIVLGAIFSFVDIGGNVILELAKNYLSENYKISLQAEKITGNPVKGYTLHNFEIEDPDGQNILSAGFLSGRVNFPALLTGKIRLAELSIGGISMDVENFLEAAQKYLTFEINDDDFNSSMMDDFFSRLSITASPAFADSGNPVPDIPIDYLRIRDSKFYSQFGTLEVNDIIADLKKFDFDVDAAFNDIPIKGKIDMGESAGLTGINRSEINFGSGKILATGGLYGEVLDIHASCENLNLKELTALYPEMLKAEDFDGTANFNVDATGKFDAIKLFGSIDYKGTKIYGFPVERVSSNVNYDAFDKRISLSNIQASAFNVPVQGEIAIADNSIMIKLDGSEANLDGLDKIFGLPELKGLTGKVSLFNANVSGTMDELNGLVNFTAPRIAYNGRAFTNIRAQLKLAKSDTAIVDGKFTFEGSQGYLQGKIASVLKAPNMDVSAKIVELDIKRVQNMIPDASDYKLSGKVTASVNVKGSPNNPVISGSLNSPEFSGWEQTITKPAVDFTFANKTLTLSKTEGTLNGMPINLSGKIWPLPSENPNLDINATLLMSPASLKNYVPDIAQYNLKGNVNAGIKITGTVNNPSVNLLASSQNLQAMDMITAQNLELTTALGGDLTKLDKLNLNISAKNITASGVTFSDVQAKLDKNDDKIMLSSLRAQSGRGKITGSGLASVSGKTPLDFSFNFKDLELAPLASASGVDMKGNLSGTLKISGSNTNPAISLNANVPALNAQGFTLNNFIADVSGNTQNLTLKTLRADVEGAELKASGTVQISPALKLNIAINGNNLKLEKLLSEYKEFSGTASLNFTISGSDKNITGKGALTSSALKAYGINLTSVNLPLAYAKNRFTSDNGTAKLYGGSAKNSFAFNTETMSFTNNLEASNVDINGLIQDASGGLNGKITGRGKLTLKINGASKNRVTYSGTGNFSTGAGGITGFKWLDIVAKVHGTKGINYTSINAPLTLQTGKLILKSGSIVNANKNDPIYTYAKLTQNGTIDFSGSDVRLDLAPELNINYQLINAIQGGTKGGLEAILKTGIKGLEDSIKTFLRGGMKEAEKTASTGDFRVVTLKISGKAASPSFSSLKIGPSTLKAQQNNSSDKKQQGSLTDRIIDRTIETLIPDKKKQTQNSQPQQQQQTQPQKKQSTRQKVEEKVKEEVKKGLQKGLGGLFKR